MNPQISDHQQSWGMRMAPGRGRGHLCWWPLIFKKNFLNLCFIGSVGFGDHLTDLLLATTLFVSAIFGSGCCADAYQQIVQNLCKILFYLNS